MTKFYKYLKIGTLVCFGIILSDCTKDDNENKIPTFTEADLSLIHGDSEKSWRITEIVNLHAKSSDELYITVDCVTDDIYTFSANNDSASISYGDTLCFDHLDEGIFRADHEAFGAKLMMLGTPQTIFLSFGRGYVNEDNTAFASTFAYYALAQLSENKMVFYKSNSEILGDYYEAYTFEAVEKPE
jgi:hypothetical protein